MQTLNLDTTFLFNSNPFNPKTNSTFSQKWYGLSPEDRTFLENTLQQPAIKQVENNIHQQQYGFIEVLKSNDYLEQIRKAASTVSWAKNLVVVGIGGSDLGGRVIQESLTSVTQQSATNVIFHGDSTDPIQIKQLLQKIDLKTTVFNIISKSGETVETITQYLFFKDKYQGDVDWRKHFIFTTDSEKGILHQEAEIHQILALPIPANVGGRFSVLTTVGLFPAAVMGVEIEKLVQGALDFVENSDSRQLSQIIATYQWLLWEKGIHIIVLMNYAVQLNLFGLWFRQLWAESLGKNEKGILPVAANGPADQHSQLQFYNEGESILSFLFLSILKRDDESEQFKVPPTEIESLKQLSGHSFARILETEKKSTALSLFNHGRPSASMTVSDLSAYSLGQLFICFELAVVYLSSYLEVDPFNQPGVEESKKMITAFLSQPQN